MADSDAQVIEEFRANAGRVGDTSERWPLVLITHTGRRSGRRITTPLMYTRDGDDIVIIASKGGADEHPLWFRNIQADGHVHVEVGTEAWDAVARIPDGEERDRLFAAQAEQMPFFAEFQEQTARQIPVVVLTRERDETRRGLS